MIATRHGVSARTSTGSALSVIAAIAPIQVGPWFGVSGSGPWRVDAVPVEQQQRPRRLDALLEQQLALRHVARLGDRGPGRELLVAQPVEEVDRAQFVDDVHAAARYSWISETAIEPSPTALATRLIERARTSPATNTPGHARLQHVRIALERPAGRLGVEPGEDEAVLVAGHDALEPVRARRGADEHERGIDGLVALALARRGSAASPGGRRRRPRPPARPCGPRPWATPRSARPGSATSTSPASPRARASSPCRRSG